MIWPPEHFTPLAQPHLSNIWDTSFVMPFLCQIANSKANPSYTNHLALKLCQVDNIPYTRPYTQYQIKIIWGSAFGEPMPLGHFWTPNYLINFPVSNWSQTPQTNYIYLPLPTVNFGNFSEMCKAPVISSSTFGSLGFLKILFCKVWSFWVWPR